MTYLRPFFLLMGRASVFWVGAAVLAGLSILLLGLSQPDEIITPYIDPVFLAAFAFPAVAGWLAGAVIQEFLHSSFAWALPSVRQRIAAGFFATGVAITSLVAGLAAQSPASSLGFVTLAAIGISGYSLSGNFFGLQRPWLGAVNLMLMILLIARSRQLSSLAASYPLPTLAIALALAALGLWSLFSRAAFRRRPFTLTTPFPGSYSLERTVDLEREKLAQAGPKHTGWKAGYLGTDTRSWVGAIFYETYGQLGWRTVPRLLDRMWVLGLLFVIYAWSDKGDLSFGEALGKTIHGALLSSPYVPVFGIESDRHPIVILVIAATGAMLSLWSPTDLKTSLAYPISRRRLATITHRLGALDSGLFFVGYFVVLMIVGQLAGWFVGYEVRFDFMPFYLHPLLGTVILMPLALWGRLQLQSVSRQKTGNTLIGLVFGILGFVALVWIWTAIATRIFSTTLSELTVSAILLLLSQSLYSLALGRYYSAADLA